MKEFRNKLSDELGNVFGQFRGYNYKDRKDKVSSLKFLKILDNKDYLIKSASIKRSKCIVDMLFIGISLKFSSNIDQQLPPQLGDVSTILHLLSLFLITVLVITSYNFIILFLSFGKHLQRIRLGLSMLMNAVIIGYFITSLQPDSDKLSLEKIIKLGFKEYHLNCIFNDKVWQFWLIFTVVSIGSCLSLYFVLKSQDIFELEGMKFENILIVGLLTIITFIIGIDLDTVRPIGIALLTLLIQTVFFDFYQQRFLSKKNEEAQKIFEVQLLSHNPDYGELKKCYYYGGEKYKEKLLSNEKFLKVIMASEIGSLNVVETYEDYKLYKEVKYKNYLESQK
mgnify:FL=1